MSWETVIGGALTGFSNFVGSLINIITGSLNPTATEGIVALILLGVAIRLINDAPKIPGKIIEKVKERVKKEDEEDYEFVMVRRRK